MNAEEQGKLTDVEKAIITLNKEMGTVQGELRIIKWLMGATVLVGLGQLFMSIFGI